MSEPEKKVDVKSLTESLEETNIGGTVEDPTENKPKEELARETMNKSNTLTIDAKQKKTDASPETLSPSSPSGEQQNEELPTSITTNKGKRSTIEDAQNQQPLNPTVQQIKNMFPDIEVDTIQAVVVAEEGDFERAINTLLQMSDPTYVPPPPRQASQVERDEQLARSIAATEEREARSQRQFVQPSGRGGALGSLFGMGGGQEQSQTPASYDPNQLSYQPRVRRTPSGQQQPQQNSYPTRPSYNSQTPSGGNGGNESSLPGPREAKQWQEDINKMAEQGFAKAASTFSALRQKGEQAWAARQQAAAAGNAGGYSNNTDSQGQQQGQKASSFFSNWNQRNASGGSASTASPTLGSGRGFDRDPSPVSENELAKILARGRNEIDNGNGAKGTTAGRKNSLGNIADRYKKVAAGQRQNSAKSPAANEQDLEDENLGWDDAGRTGNTGAGGGKSFEPIKINDNSTDEPKESTAKAHQRTAVSLMESSAGRGITSPKIDSSQADKQEGGYDIKHNDEDDDDDDLEYVANPFEDED